MIKAFISDFSRVLLFPKDKNYSGGLNDLHKKLSADGDYDFFSYFTVNQDLLNFYKSISQYIDVYLFTSEHIQEHKALEPYLRGIFKKVFSGSELGLKKTEVDSYTFIAQSIGVKPEEIVFLDDSSSNVDAAQKAGIQSVHYKFNVQAKEMIERYLKGFEEV